MGKGVAGFITPGWWFHEHRYNPELSKKPDYVEQMLKTGEAPKPAVIKDCEPHCTYWKDKLTRCESQLEVVIKINPTKTCLYNMRDYVTCVEACTQPLIHNVLQGTE